MENKITFRTKPVYVCVDKYEKYSFNYQGWTIADSYELNESSPRHSRYSITISSPSISTEDELNNFSLQGQKIAEMITELIPISGLPSLNSPKYKSFCNNREFVAYKSAPSGWSTNYTTIQSMLNKEKSNEIRLDVTFEGIVHFSVLEQSPLPDLQHMLEHYDDAEEPIKFLLFLNNSILSANDINVFMLIGKALEIVDAIYPYHGPEEDDNRIKIFFPELSDTFGEHTLKRLCHWCNKRKEARHYIKVKHERLPHDPLSKEERIALCRCSNSLIMNVIRHAFHLPHSSVVFK